VYCLFDVKECLYLNCPHWDILWTLKCLGIFISGNLALSRALGDFVFKRNNMKEPEEQIVTGSLDF